MMEKYRISSKGLRSAFRKLLNLGAITQAELDSRLNLYGEAAGATGLRKVPRKRISNSLWVYDAGDPFEATLTRDISETDGGDSIEAALIRDISDKGLCIDGIRTKIGESKTFMVRLGPLEGHSTFVFEAQCRWIGGKAQRNGEMVAGFEITDISPEDLKILQEMLKEGDATSG
jgi:hypothetical protein